MENHQEVITVKLFTQRTHLLRRAGMVCLTLALCWGLSQADPAEALYILTGASDSAIVLDGSAVEKDFSSQLVYLGTKASGLEVTLTAGQTVVIHHEGATLSAQARTETISQLLSRLHLEISPLEMVLVDLSGTGADLTIASDLTYYDRVVEPVQYTTRRVTSADLPKGTESVVQAGANGTRTAIYEVVWSGGELLSRQLVQELDCSAVEEVIATGTAVSSVSGSDRISKVTTNSDGSGVLTFASGDTMKFSAAKSMTATAYTAGHGGADSCTATGTSVRVGTVAVDKRVIPLGTRMYIVTNDGRVVYGMAVAEDTGVRGNVVDLYYDTYQQCISFGRRGCTVYLLK